MQGSSVISMAIFRINRSVAVELMILYLVVCELDVRQNAKSL